PTMSTLPLVNSTAECPARGVASAPVTLYVSVTESDRAARDAIRAPPLARSRPADEPAGQKLGDEGRHYVVTLPQHRTGHRYDPVKGLRCEIQLRTICQDAWAQISRYLDYPTTDAL